MCHENKHESAFLFKKALHLQKRSSKRAETSTGKSCDPNRWNAQAGRAAGTKEDTRLLNAYLDKLQSKAQELHQVMSVGDETVTAETVKDRFIGKALQSKTPVAVFEDHNAKMKSLIGKEFEKSTLQRYETCLMHVKDFIGLPISSVLAEKSKRYRNLK
nr:Arm DNA-binding domain-containing protein [Pedobacter borealis]